MEFIGLGDVNKSLIAIIVGCIFCFLNRILNLFAETELFKNKILTNIFISFADVFTVIPYIITKRRSKSKFIKTNIKFLNLTKEESRIGYKHKEIYDIQDSVKNKKYYILLIGIVFFANYFMFVYIFKIESNTWITYILFTSIFYYFICKAKLFSHHYLSIIIILLAGLIIDIFQNNFKNDFETDIIGFIFSIIRVILLSLIMLLLNIQ